MTPLAFGGNCLVQDDGDSIVGERFDIDLNPKLAGAVNPTDQPFERVISQDVLEASGGFWIIIIRRLP